MRNFRSVDEVPSEGGVQFPEKFYGSADGPQECWVSHPSVKYKAKKLGRKTLLHSHSLNLVEAMHFTGFQMNWQAGSAPSPLALLILNRGGKGLKLTLPGLSIMHVRTWRITDGPSASGGTSFRERLSSSYLNRRKVEH